MKKSILILALCVLAMTASFADDQNGARAGKFLLGLNLHPGEIYMSEIPLHYAPFGICVGQTTDEDGDSFGWLTATGTIEAGYFLSDGFYVGLTMFFAMFFPLDDDYSLIQGAPGVEAGYIFNLGGSVAPYILLNAAFMYMKAGDNTYLGFKLMPSAGIKIFLIQEAALDLGLFFNYSRLDEQDSVDPSSLENMFLGLRFGVNLFL